jgi:hypothetical protein
MDCSYTFFNLTVYVEITVAIIMVDYLDSYYSDWKCYTSQLVEDKVINRAYRLNLRKYVN